VIAGVSCATGKFQIINVEFSTLATYQKIMTPPLFYRGGGEWEPIEILYENLAYVPNQTQRSSLLTRPRPLSYWPLELG
jgi:hypothetical protein